jgi:hypothetical protein
MPRGAIAHTIGDDEREPACRIEGRNPEADACRAASASRAGDRCHDEFCMSPIPGPAGQGAGPEFA